MTERVWNFKRFIGGRHVSSGAIVANNIPEAASKLRMKPFPMPPDEGEHYEWTQSTQTPEEFRVDLKRYRDGAANT